MSKTLYSVKTIGLGEYLVLEESFDKAAELLKRILDHKDYGSWCDREIKSITVITQEITNYDGTEIFISDDFRKLVLPEHLQLTNGIPK